MSGGSWAEVDQWTVAAETWACETIEPIVIDRESTVSFFEILAECSVTFAGFGAVHAALMGDGSPRTLHRSFTIVLCGSLAFVLSVVVLLLADAGWSASTLWRTTSIIGACLCALGAWFFLIGHQQTSRIGFGAQSPVVFTIAAVFIFLPAPLLALNAVGWPWPTGPHIYKVALVMVLVSGALGLLGSFWFPLTHVVRELEETTESADSEEPE